MFFTSYPRRRRTLQNRDPVRIRLRKLYNELMISPGSGLERFASLFEQDQRTKGGDNETREAGSEVGCE
jgi:hypothetical protein